MKFEALKNKLLTAYETSTPANNQFKDAIFSVKWDRMFKSDGEYYFVKDGHTFTTPSYDPFDMPWKPSIMPSDCSGVIEF